MTNHEATLKAHAELLISALVDVNNAQVKFEVLSNEKDVHKGTRVGMKKSIKECQQIFDRFNRFWGDEGKKVMEEQILGVDSTLQIQEVTHAYMGLDKIERDAVENFIENLIKVRKYKNG